MYPVNTYHLTMLRLPPPQVNPSGLLAHLMVPTLSQQGSAPLYRRNSPSNKNHICCKNTKVHPVLYKAKIPTPVNESTLQLSCTHLAILNISHATIKVYSSAICHMHVLAGLNEHFSKPLVLRGIKKTQAQTSSPQNMLAHT